MAYKFVQLYDKNGIKTFPVKGPSCVVTTNNNGTAYWYKFATLKATGNNRDASVVFQINKSYGRYGYGLLYVHLRTDTTEAFGGVKLNWVAHTGIYPLDWAINYNGRTADLYLKKNGQYEDFHIEVVSGETISNNNNSLNYTLTLYDSLGVTGLTTLPTTGSTIYSSSALYQVGDVIVTTNGTDPKNYYGGTWTKITDRFLIGAGNSYGVGGTGGGSSVTLTTSHMPSHSHSMPAHNHWFELTSGGGGWHTHGVYSHNGNTGSWEFLRPSGWTGGNGWRQVDAAAEHTHWVAGWTGNNNGAGSTNANGSGSAFSIIPPYYAIYFWRRTA
jgi:hypothetical protein